MHDEMDDTVNGAASEAAGYRSHRRQVAVTFDRAAGSYDRHAALEQEVGRRLLERSAFCRREPQCILDLGCGTGAGAEALKQKYRRALVVGLDLSPGMLNRFVRRSRWLKPLSAVLGDLAALPFARATADLVFVNLADPWVPDRSAVLDEYRRVLRPGGMLLFSTLGPATLAELRVSGGAAPAEARFPDVLEIGDALVAAGFRDPVMDVESITVQYPGIDAMLRELEITGAALLVAGWRGQADDAAWRDTRESLPLAEKYPVTYEIVYGTAFGPEESQPARRTGADPGRRGEHDLGG